MARRRLLVTLLGGLALVSLLLGLAAHHVGVNDTALLITVGMFCGPAVAASALVGACSLLDVQAVEVRER